MASRIYHKLQHPDRQVKFITGEALITGSTGKVISVSGIGIRSGSTGAAGVHTIFLGSSGSASSVPNDKYNSLKGAFFSVEPVLSASSWAPPLSSVRLQSDYVSASGSIVFTTTQLSSSATSGVVTEAVGAPTLDIRVKLLFAVKNSDV